MRAFRFLRPEAAGELLALAERTLARSLPAPDVLAVTALKGGGVLRSGRLWSLRFEPVSPDDFYRLPRV